PYLWALGRREAEQRSVSIRRLGSEEQRSLALDEAIGTLRDEAKVPNA
ncbi:MAG: His/Gly/Thr/Pro-type tRNA ligase C-terminal domain-containing protein, partial [Gemmatimonadota bacterium]